VLGNVVSGDFYASIIDPFVRKKPREERVTTENSLKAKVERQESEAGVQSENGHIVPSGTLTTRFRLYCLNSARHGKYNRTYIYNIHWNS